MKMTLRMWLVVIVVSLLGMVLVFFAISKVDAIEVAEEQLTSGQWVGLNSAFDHLGNPIYSDGDFLLERINFRVKQGDLLDALYLPKVFINTEGVTSCERWVWKDEQKINEDRYLKEINDMESIILPFEKPPRKLFPIAMRKYLENLHKYAAILKGKSDRLAEIRNNQESKLLKKQIEERLSDLLEFIKEIGASSDWILLKAVRKDSGPYQVSWQFVAIKKDRVREMPKFEDLIKLFQSQK